MTHALPSPRTAATVLGLGLCFAAGGCSAADNLTYPEIATELDGIVQIEGTGAARHVRYAEHAPVSAWYLRSPLTQPIRWPLALAFGASHDAELENPAGHVRELLAEVPDEVGADLDYGCDAFVRLLVLGELDPGIGVQGKAIDVLCAIATQLRLPMFAGDLAVFGAAPDATRVAAAQAALQAGRPDRRDGHALDAARAANYRDGLQALVARALPSWSERVALVADLGACWRLEDDAALRELTDQCLRQACCHALEAMLVRVVQGRDPAQVDLRLTAMQQVRRLGGPRAVPLLLAVMAASANEVRAGRERFDPDPQVQLRLIHLCGQLRGELSLQALRLANRDGWEPVAPADFLALTILKEQDFFSKLRVSALYALSLSLGRPRYDFESEWVSAWFRNRQRQS